MDAGAANKVIVTGGAGFIGSALCRHLIKKTNWQVLNIDKLTYAASLSSLDSIAADPRYRFEKIDICDTVLLSKVFEQYEPSAVFHLAAESHVDKSIDGSADFIRTNVMGTHSLLEVSRLYWAGMPKAKSNDFRFLMVSTDEVYGSLRAQDEPFTEESLYDPSSPYAASKASADHLASAWHRTYGLPVLISNCSNNFGPFQFPEKLIPLSILNALESRPIRLYGDGSNVRDWLHVSDHASALVQILLAGQVGHKYNVGARNERSNREVIEQICAIMDEQQPEAAPHFQLVTFVVDRPGHDFRYAIDPRKVEREIGFRPSHSFAEGLRETVIWYLKNREWWGPLRQRYAGTRLGNPSVTKDVQ